MPVRYGSAKSFATSPGSRIAASPVHVPVDASSGARPTADDLLLRRHYRR